MHTNIYSNTVIHYSEIGIKKGNRKIFEKILAKNIKVSTGLAPVLEYGRLVINQYNNETSQKLKLIPGIANFSPAASVSPDIEEIKEKLLTVASSVFSKYENKGQLSFCIRTIRANKSFPLTSVQVNEILGAHIINHKKIKVDLSNPIVTLYVEIGEKNVFIYTEKFEGLGGLPVGSSGSVLVLLSGGIDSPVASYKMMLRGCHVVFVHFHNYTSRIEDKLERLVSVLNKYQTKSKIWIIPFLEFQEKIIESVPPNYRMIMYRRLMLKMAEQIAKKESCKALVTGDSLGQVASQTLENLSVIYDAAKMPILSPLIGSSKQDIIDIAQEIGTYEISIEKYRDCCSWMIAKHPETKADIKFVKKLEKGIKKSIPKGAEAKIIQNKSLH